MKSIYLVLIFGLLAFSCSKTEVQSCDQEVIIDKELYDQTETENYSIKGVTIIDDCFEVELSASGCDGNSWIIKLIDLGAISESNPIQRNLKINLINSEDCLTSITQQISFNIKQLRTNDNQILLNLEGWDELIGYHY